MLSLLRLTFKQVGPAKRMTANRRRCLTCRLFGATFLSSSPIVRALCHCEIQDPRAAAATAGECLSFALFSLVLGFADSCRMSGLDADADAAAAEVRQKIAGFQLNETSEEERREEN